MTLSNLPVSWRHPSHSIRAGHPPERSAAQPPADIVSITCHAEHRRLLRYFKRRVGPDEAPDLVQDVFTRLFGSEQLDRIENPAAYLTRIARNLLIDRARRKKLDRPIFYPLDEGRDAPARPEQTWRIEAMDLLRIYRRVVGAMPPKTRRVFLMHRLRHLTYNDIAVQLGISTPTVEYHMMRALALCRTAIATQQ